MANDITKKIRFEADITSLQNTMQQLGPLFRQLESQLKINIPMTMGQGGGNFGQSGGGIWMPGGGVPSLQSGGVQDIKNTPAYQLLQMQEALRTKTDKLDVGMGGKTASQMMEERLASARSGGKMTDITAMEKLLEHSKTLDKEFERLTKTIEKLDRSTETLNDQQMKEATTAKKDLADVQRQRIDMMGASGGMTGGTAGSGGMLDLIKGSITTAGVLTAVKAIAELPMSRAAAAASTGQLQARDIASTMNLTDFASLMRSDPNARGAANFSSRTTGTVRGLLDPNMMSMVGAGIGGFAGSLLMPGAGTYGGAALGYGAANWLSGKVEQAQNNTFEERMALEVQKAGPEGERFRSLFAGGEMMGPMQRGFGMGLGQTRRFMGGPGQYLMRQHSMSPQELNELSLGMGNVMGQLPTGNIRDVGAMNTMAGLMRGTGLSGSELGAGLGAFSGVGSGRDTADQARNLEDIFARGASRGFSNAPLLRQYFDVVSRVAGQAAGGFGAVGTGAIGAYGQVIQDTFGGPATAATATAAAAGMTAMAGLEVSKVGVQGMVNAMAGDAASQKLIAMGVDPRKAMTIGQIIMSSDQQQLSDERVVAKLAAEAGIGVEQMRGVIGSAVGAKLTGIGDMMGGITGSADLASIQALVNTGTSLTGAVETTATLKGAAGAAKSGAIFTGGRAGEAARGLKEFKDKDAAVSALPNMVLQTATALNTLSTAFDPKTIGEIGTRLQGLGGNLKELNPLAADLATHFKRMSDEMVRMHGANPPREDKTPKGRTAPRHK